MKRLLFWIATALMMTGCSPSVTSDMLTHDFAPQPTNKVMIYGAKDSVPAAVRAIGKVTVDGKSISVTKQYARALGLAITETARNGGNVLVVDNSEIKENRMKGTIAYTDEAVNKSLTLSAERVAQLQTTGFAGKSPAVMQMDSAKQQAVVQQQVADWEKTHDSRGGLVKISVGPAWTTSKLYLTYDGKEYVTNQRGYALSLSISNTGGKAYGFGCDFYGCYTKIDVPSMLSYVDCSYTMMYLGPCALIGGNLADWLRLDASMGLGAVYYQDDGDTKFGFGTRFSLGLEFMVSKNAGLGIDLVRQLSLFKRPEGFKLPDNEIYGYQQVAVMMTGRFHF